MIALQESEKEEVVETVKFCGMMNDFFDCTNVRSTTEYIRKRNHSSSHIHHQKMSGFPGCLRNFSSTSMIGSSVSQCVLVNSQKTRRAGCFCHYRHMKGLRSQLIPMLKPSDFSWSKDSSMSCLSDSCKMYWRITLATNVAKEEDQITQQFGYNDLTIASQRDIAPAVRGNVGRRYEKKWYQVCDEPVHKRKKVKKTV